MGGWPTQVLEFFFCFSLTNTVLLGSEYLITSARHVLCEVQIGTSQVSYSLDFGSIVTSQLHLQHQRAVLSYEPGSQNGRELKQVYYISKKKFQTIKFN